MSGDDLFLLYLGGLVAMTLAGIGRAIVGKTQKERRGGGITAAFSFLWPLTVTLLLIFGPVAAYVQRQNEEDAP